MLTCGAWGTGDSELVEDIYVVVAQGRQLV